MKDGSILPAGLTIGVAGALPHPWLQNTDLALTDGFIDVNSYLQTTDNEDLFAAGDCAHLTHAPRPKAGVYAVRAAPVLFDNLRARLIGQALRPFHPQKDYLKLITLGEKSALAEKWGRVWYGPWLWWVKNRIDQKFMRMFKELPDMAHAELPSVMAQDVAHELGDGQPICAGCGAKVSAGTLGQALLSLPAVHRPDVLTGRGDDAAILQIGGQKQVLTTDHLKAFTEDPALMARIAAVHALGDIWAMGATPQAALASIILPRMSARLQSRTLTEIMSAAQSVLGAAGAEIVGGHTTQGAEMTIGFTLTGLAEHPITHAGAQPGDVLILTRPIGSGVLLAAEMQTKANGAHIAAMLHEMSRPQTQAAQLLRGAHAMTDVTGFGLAGHLLALCRASGVGAQLDIQAIPLYAGAAELSGAGVRSTLYASNLAQAPVPEATGPAAALLHDPQTAGGLLAAVAPQQAPEILRALSAQGLRAAAIGQMIKGPAEIRCQQG